MASYPSGLRDRFAKPLFAGSNPADASLNFEDFIAWVVELVDTTDLKSVGSNAVPVRVRPRVQSKKGSLLSLFSFLHKTALCHCVTSLLII